MQRGLLKLIIFTLFLSSRFVYSQYEGTRYPIRFSQYYNCFSISNPASAGSVSDVEIAMGNQRLLGNFSKISTYFLSANTRFLIHPGIANSTFSTIGIFAYNDKEGKYLNRSRFYITYVWHGNITRKLKMAGGFHLGGMNYSVKGTVLSGDGSDIVPDGAVGLQLYGSDFHVGVAINQIFHSEVQPLEEISELIPYLNITGMYRYSMSKSLTIAPNYVISQPLNKDKNKIDATLLITYKEKYLIGIGIHDNTKFINTIEFKSLIETVPDLNFAVTYSYSLTKTDIGTSFLELGINYNYNRREFK